MSSVELPKTPLKSTYTRTMTVTVIIDAEKERQRQKKYRKNRYQNDPEWREHIQTQNREKYRLKKVKELGEENAVIKEYVKKVNCKEIVEMIEKVLKDKELSK